MTDFKFSTDPIIQYPQYETRKNNQSFYIIFTGPPGGGKSYACIEFLRLSDPNFTVDRIAFTAKEFIQLLKQDLPPGSAIMWDEMGVEFDSREFMSVVNKILSHVTMTMRYRRQIIGITVPDMDWIDLKWRKLLHMYAEMMKKFEGEKAVGKLHILQTNYRFGKTYHKSPIRFKDGMPFVMRTIKFPKPPESLIIPYEVRKRKYGDNVLNEADSLLNELEGRKQQKKHTDHEILSYVNDHRDEFVNTHTHKLNTDKIALKFDLSNYRMDGIKRKLKTAGMTKTSRKKR